MGEDPFRKRLTKGYRREVQNFQPLFVNEDEFMLNKDTDNNSEDSILKIPILKIPTFSMSMS